MTDRTWTWLVNGLRGILEMLETEHGPLTADHLARLEEYSARLARLVERERSKRACTPSGPGP
jgi:hypothetical protein